MIAEYDISLICATQLVTNASDIHWQFIGLLVLAACPQRSFCVAESTFVKHAAFMTLSWFSLCCSQAAGNRHNRGRRPLLG